MCSIPKSVHTHRVISVRALVEHKTNNCEFSFCVSVRVGVSLSRCLRCSCVQKTIFFLFVLFFSSFNMKWLPIWILQFLFSVWDFPSCTRALTADSIHLSVIAAAAAVFIFYFSDIVYFAPCIFHSLLFLIFSSLSVCLSPSVFSATFAIVTRLFGNKCSFFSSAFRVYEKYVGNLICVDLLISQRLVVGHFALRGYCVYNMTYPCNVSRIELVCLMHSNERQCQCVGVDVEIFWRRRRRRRR